MKERRSALGLVVGGIIALAAAVPALVLATGAESVGRTRPSPTVHVDRVDRPNIVLILTDDQRWDTLWSMPNVRRQLMDHGVTFTNGFVVNSLCCPSRTSILTGRYSHGTGVYTNFPPLGGVEAFDPSVSIATKLQAGGYRTGLIGKYLNDYRGPEVPPGWDRWVSFDGGGANVSFFDYTLNVDGRQRAYGSAPSDYSTDVLTDDAVRFIGEGGKRPFFLYFAPVAPHLPAIPAPRDLETFSRIAPFRPAAFDETDTSDKPPWVREVPPMGATRLARIAEIRRDQLRSLQAVDDAVGRIVSTLKRQGALDDTLLVFMSDNGYLLGEHRLSGKEAPYEESIRVPLIVRYDPLTRSARRQDPRFALNIDLAPTFAEASGVHLPKMDGQSLLPLLEDPSLPGRRSFLVEHVGPPIPTYCAVHGTRWKYVYYADGSQELYDLQRDPHELQNLIGPPAAHAAWLRMSARLRTLCDPTPPGLVLPG